MKIKVVLLLAASVSSSGFAQAILDTLSDKLRFEPGDRTAGMSLSFMADATAFAAESVPQGMLFQDDSLFLAPRLLSFLDVQLGDRVTAHAQMRLDRGFDPGSAPDGQVRLDEYFVQARLWRQDEANVRLGKFATAFGSWQKRSLSWDNPFVTAPMIYEDMLPITDQFAPPGLAGFAGRRNLADNKPQWLPAIWGPSYATGLSLFGRIDALEYNLEIKSAGLSSRPEAWDALQNGWPSSPVFSGRLGWHPGPEWNLGASFSRGPFMQDSAEFSLPRGTSVNDFAQSTLGLDAGYAHHRWQVWGELLASRFEVPNVGDVDVFGGFIEAKYKITSQWWAAMRWNHALFGDLPGSDTGWGRDAWRTDLALGYRFTEHAQLKLQYSVGDKLGDDPEGNHLGALQFTLRF